MNHALVGILATLLLYGFLALAHTALYFWKCGLRRELKKEKRRADILQVEVNRMRPLEAKFMRAFQRPRGKRGKFLRKAPTNETDRTITEDPFGGPPSNHCCN